MSLTFLMCRLLLPKRWSGVGRLVKYVGAAAIEAMAAMEKRGLYPSLGTFKDVEGIMLDRLWEIVGYMDGTKSTLSGLKKVIKDVEEAQMWSWHILHLDTVANGLVDISRGMLPSNRNLCSYYATYLAEISANFRFFQIMDRAHPSLCSPTYLQLHLVLSKWPKAMCNCVPPKGSLWLLDLV